MPVIPPVVRFGVFELDPGTDKAVKKRATN